MSDCSCNEYDTPQTRQGRIMADKTGNIIMVLLVVYFLVVGEG